LSKLKFIDLFAGIGGFHLALHKLDAECVLAAEIDNMARKTYEENFTKLSPKLFKNGKFYTDVTTIKTEDIPDFDILCAGFPCQPFSNIGKQRGFSDTRGTLFFEIARILKDKSPQVYILENVRGLLSHNDGNTFKIIKKTLLNLGYSFNYKILRASDYGVPQNRPRLFMVGFKDNNIEFEFPKAKPLKKTMSDIFNAPCDRDIGYTLRVGGKNSPPGDRHAWDWYRIEGQWVQLNSTHAKEMQGFPKSFKFPVSESQTMKQLGNAVAIPVVQAIYKNIIKVL